MLDFRPFINHWGGGAVLANLLEVQVSEGEAASNLLAAGAVDLSQSHITDDLLVGRRLARSEEAEWDVLLPSGKEEESCGNL